MISQLKAAPPSSDGQFSCVVCEEATKGMYQCVVCSENIHPSFFKDPPCSKLLETEKDDKYICTPCCEKQEGEKPQVGTNQAPTGTSFFKAIILYIIFKYLFRKKKGRESAIGEGKFSLSVMVSFHPFKGANIILL